MICVSIAEKSLQACIEALAQEKLAEIRIDQTRSSSDELRTLCSQQTQIIATCRPGEYSDDERGALLIDAMEAGAQYIDIEVESSDSFKDKMLGKARECGTKIIMSYHDYEKTPYARELEQLIAWCFDSGADIAKIACQANTRAECARILALYNNDDSKQIVAIGMGKLGAITRIAAPLLGAPFTYASISAGRETASGQLTKDTLRSIWEMIDSE
jgi:3-dehydroquinate dehydratase-1